MEDWSTGVGVETARLLRSLLRPAAVEATCGLCCSGASAVSLHDEVALRSAVETLQLRHILAAVVGSVIEEDVLPASLCLACTNAAVTSYRFLQLCRSYSATLTSLAHRVRDAANEVSSKSIHSKTNSIFVLLNDKVNEVFIDKSDRINDGKSALSRFQYLIKRKRAGGMQCDVCGKTFNSKYYVEKHQPRCRMLLYENTSLESGAGACPFVGCFKRYPSRTLLRLHEMRAHHEKKHPCDTCHKKFGSPELVAEHIRAKHAYRECRVCHESFVGTKNLWLHEKTHAETAPTEKVKMKSKYKIICDICGQKFPRIASLRRHMVGKHGFPGPPEAKPPSTKLYKCELCDFICKRRDYIKIHQARVHFFSERRYSCELCGKCFHRGSDLSRHKVTHTRQRPEQCATCERRFVNKAALLYHTRLHTGERPYQCDHCGERFLSASRRGHHVQVKHGSRLQCPHCPNSYTENKSLKKHIQKQHAYVEGKNWKVNGFCPPRPSLSRHRESPTQNFGRRAKILRERSVRAAVRDSDKILDSSSVTAAVRDSEYNILGDSSVTAAIRDSKYKILGDSSVTAAVRDSEYKSLGDSSVTATVRDSELRF